MSLSTKPACYGDYMDWQSRLIETYLTVCKYWEQGVWTVVQRHSNNQEAALSDEEVVTIYIFGIQKGQKTAKSAFQYASDHLISWFLNLGNYNAFTQSLNRISDAFISITRLISEQLESELSCGSNNLLLDSLPIVMANNARSSTAKVANEIADKGYCGSKKMFYHGVKLHIAGFFRRNGIPIPSVIGITEASKHDLSAFKDVAPEIHNCDVFADKAYLNKDFRDTLKKQQNCELCTPIKLGKGQKILDSADRMYSRAVSKVRQPIESLFNWLIAKTAIQDASKVRSSRGLIVHVFGRMSAGLLLMKT